MRRSNVVTCDRATRGLWTLVLAATAISASACGEAEGAPRAITAPAALRADLGAAGDQAGAQAGVATDGGVGIAALPLPVNETYTGAGTAFKIANSVNAVTSHAGEFTLTGGSGANALRVTSNGTNYALRVANTATGSAGFFSSVATATAGLPTVQSQANGPNSALYAYNGSSSGRAAQFIHRSNSLAGGVSVVQSAGSGDAFRTDQQGTGPRRLRDRRHAVVPRHKVREKGPLL